MATTPQPLPGGRGTPIKKPIIPKNPKGPGSGQPVQPNPPPR